MQEEISRRPKVYIVIYSLYHHIYKLSLAIREELEVCGIDAQIFQVPETLSDQVLEKMHAPAKPDVPVIQVNQLAEPDGLMFGIPTRFGIFPAQMKEGRIEYFFRSHKKDVYRLLDASGQLWAKGSLAGKFAATFFSTASQHGGQETTALHAVTYFAHHGLLYVPFGFANASLFDNNDVVGGSAYGAGTITNGDGSRQPSEQELDIAKNQAANFAKILNQYHRGKLAIAVTTSTNATTTTTTTSAAPAPAPVVNLSEEGTKNDAAMNASAPGDTATGTVVAPAAVAATAGTAAAVASKKNPASIGADSDASIRSLKAVSTQNQINNNRDMPLITTTSPEGLTEPQRTNETIEGADSDIRRTNVGTGSAATAPPGQRSSAQVKPKKKKKFLFCCGGGDLD
ncbi:flavoprotein-like protein [Dichotomocladium elegans]|nr:flavoprotein-like protein [Dichotomocladium elegans]